MYPNKSPQNAVPFWTPSTAIIWVVEYSQSYLSAYLYIRTSGKENSTSSSSQTILIVSFRRRTPWNQIGQIQTRKSRILSETERRKLCSQSLEPELAAISAHGLASIISFTWEKLLKCLEKNRITYRRLCITNRQRNDTRPTRLAVRGAPETNKRCYNKQKWKWHGYAKMHTLPLQLGRMYCCYGLCVSIGSRQ